MIPSPFAISFYSMVCRSIVYPYLTSSRKLMMGCRSSIVPPLSFVHPLLPLLPHRCLCVQLVPFWLKLIAWMCFGSRCVSGRLCYGCLGLSLAVGVCAMVVWVALSRWALCYGCLGCSLVVGVGERAFVLWLFGSLAGRAKGWAGPRQTRAYTGPARQTTTPGRPRGSRSSGTPAYLNPPRDITVRVGFGT